ncbi:Ribosomal protein S6 kinase beta-2 [Sparganum proliferum]
MAKFLPSIRKQGDGGELTARSDATEPDSGRKAKDNTLLNEDDLEIIDVNEPPTRYYFAAYLAPEIYSQPNAANQFIDSWGLGYIVVEMVLGYGM